MEDHGASLDSAHENAKLKQKNGEVVKHFTADLQNISNEVYINGDLPKEEQKECGLNHFLSNGHGEVSLPNQPSKYSYVEKIAPHISINNNIVKEKYNIVYPDDKSLCYHKFPPKINNSYASSCNDGMDEYFKKNAIAKPFVNGQALNECNQVIFPCDISGSDSQNVNSLNIEDDDDDDDSCVYMYKGGRIFEDSFKSFLNTCSSCGLPTAERSLNSQNEINECPKASQDQKDLFSPEMDFLEMDFDPDSNGDGDIGSDCDNCFPEENGGNAPLNGNVSFALDKDTDSCSTEKSDFCKMCDSKIDNVALNISVDQNNLGVMPTFSNDCIESCSKDVSRNLSQSNLLSKKDLSLKLNLVTSNDSCRLLNREVELDQISPDEFQGDEGNEADDENDDSLSEHLATSTSDHSLYSCYAQNICNSKVLSNPSTDDDFFSHCQNVNISDTQESNNIQDDYDYSNDRNNCCNNNLGSVSAPEVSPATEYNPLAKFCRSHSFHNQLSSPKCENICIQRNKIDENLFRNKFFRLRLEKVDASNSYLCSGRLRQRDAIFNILSDSEKKGFPVYDSEYKSLSELGKNEEQTIPKVMIWTEHQAVYRPISQIGPSMCGATAVLNVLLAFDFHCNIEEVLTAVKTKQRAESSSVVEYLLSRSVAGTTHAELIDGIKIVSAGKILGRFFHLYPKRAIQLSRWLVDWIRKGGIPLVTINPQVGVAPEQSVPDAWHHQMVFGVGPQGIYLTNPPECVSDSLLSEQLCTDSVLLVRRSDIISRWDGSDNLVRLIELNDERWIVMNVLGQVVGILKEQQEGSSLSQEVDNAPYPRCRRYVTSHITIPAAYKSGVSVFMRSDNVHINQLMEASELPLLE